METLNSFTHQFNTYLKTVLNDLPQSSVKEAMIYALEGGGKRFRPQLIFASSQVNEIDECLLSLAVALEMIHTYSLVHDDLPLMDNDDYRRGRLTTHKVFNDAIALLAGDGLLTQAFSKITSSNLDDKQKAHAVFWLSKAAGASGMVMGQDLDMKNEEDNHLSDELLNELYRLKTGALFGCAFVLGRIYQKDYKDLESLYELGLDLGVLFQIQDDYLEAISDFETLGKPVNSDETSHKLTWVNRYSLDETKAYLIKGFEALKRDIINLRLASQSLLELIDKVENRKH